VLRDALMKTGKQIFQERTADLDDVAGRLLRNLEQRNDEEIILASIQPDSVLVASEISPSLMLQIQNVAGIVTERGGLTAHVSILARDRGIPAIVGAAGVVSELSGGEPAIVNAFQGNLVICPNETDFRVMDEWKAKLAAGTVYSPVSMTDNTQILLWTNLDSENDAGDSRIQRLSGVGLFRTEYLYVHSDDLFDNPAAHAALYERILARIGGKTVTFRLLDFGADKPVPHNVAHHFARQDHHYAEASHDDGLRGITLLLASPSALLGQLRAIMTAAKSRPHQVRILLPMVSHVREIDDFLVMFRRAAIAEALDADKAGISLGAMLETPAACLSADRLSRSGLQFFSIGTNDLSAFTLGIDRFQSGSDDQFYNPAVFRMIQSAVQGSTLPVSVCGEMASRPDLIPVLVGLGIRELSGPLTALPAVVDGLRTLSLHDCISRAEAVLACDSSEQVKAVLK
ncbi:MAG: phosphoenolpyruvate--protein phosphotransferase, partial [Spirochaetia bacterium]|nr:phosphoenolpyruvate--protein phosphotransferase [Spirochaetia bacterium]